MPLQFYSIPADTSLPYWLATQRTLPTAKAPNQELFAVWQEAAKELPNAPVLNQEGPSGGGEVPGGVPSPGGTDSGAPVSAVQVSLLKIATMAVICMVMTGCLLA